MMGNLTIAAKAAMTEKSHICEIKFLYENKKSRLDTCLFKIVDAVGAKWFALKVDSANFIFTE